jgi:hypothetical protein
MANKGTSESLSKNTERTASESFLARLEAVMVEVENLTREASRHEKRVYGTGTVYENELYPILGLVDRLCSAKHDLYIARKKAVRMKWANRSDLCKSCGAPDSEHQGSM